MKKINIKVSATKNNFSAISESKDLNGFVIATGKTLEELKKDFESGLAFHLEGCKEDGDILPDYIVQGKYELDFVLDTSALLLDLSEDITLAAISRASGINQRQLGHYKSGEKEPRPEQRKKIIDGIHLIAEKLNSVV